MNKNNKKGAAQGGADNAKDPADAAKQLDYLGSARGYTQNFGPARQSGYQKGAAKVAQIMGKDGPAQNVSLDHAEKKDPVSGGSFGDAFSKAGGQNFTWQGKEYSGLTKEGAEGQIASASADLASERNLYNNPPKNSAYTGMYELDYQHKSGIRRQASINQMNQGLAALGKSASGESVSPEFNVKSQQTYMQDTPSGYKGTDSEGKDYVHTKDPYSKK